MSKRWIKAGIIDQTIDIFVLDSSSTTGAGLTGLTNGTSGLTCYYRKGQKGSAQQLTLASQTVGGDHADGGFVAIDGTNMPGLYRLDLSDTMVASEGMLTIYLRGATNMAPVVAELEIVDVDIYDSVRMGLTALPNAAAEASGGLATLSAAQASNGTIPVDVVKISGDATAADNLEAATDGTGYNVGNGQIQALSVANAVTVGTINSDVITASAIATSAAQELADTFWQADNDTKYSTGQWDNDSFGRTVLRSSDTQAEVDVNGNRHISANVHQIQDNAITAAALATDAVTEIAQGVLSEATSTNPATYAVGDVGNVLGRLVNMIEADGADFRYTTNALEQAPSGGPGGGWELNEDQTTGLKRMISAIVGVGGETATPGVLEFDMIGETTTLRITQSTDGNDRLTVEEV